MELLLSENLKALGRIQLLSALMELLLSENLKALGQIQLLLALMELLLSEHPRGLGLVQIQLLLALTQVLFLLLSEHPMALAPMLLLGLGTMAEWLPTPLSLLHKKSHCQPPQLQLFLV
jgi:hypothetical protein